MNLQDQILVLDRQYTPVRISPAKEIIPLLCVDKAVALNASWITHNFDEWVDYSSLVIREHPEITSVIRSPSLSLLVPEVMVIQNYIRNPKKCTVIPYNRINIFKRDKFTCQYCGKKYTRKELTTDHVLPRSRSGPTNWLNVVTACKSCNTKKDNKTPEEARMPLLKKPDIPTWKDHIRDEAKEMWVYFL